MLETVKNIQNNDDADDDTNESVWVNEISASDERFVDFDTHLPFGQFDDETEKYLH